MLVMEIFVGLITGTVLGLALGAGTAWLTLRSRSGEADAQARAEHERERAELAQARSEAAQTRTDAARTLTEVAQAREDAALARADKAEAEARLASAQAAVAGATAQRDAAVARAAEIASDREQLVAQFKVLSTETMEHQGKQVEAAAEQRLKATEQLMQPVKESLERFNSRLVEVEKERVAVATDLRAQVAAVQLTGENLRRETTALATALRKPQVRGAWGELQLKRVVELAGMVEHCDFEQQATTQTSSGATIRPDLKVTLSEGRFIYVDSKVPLSAFLDAYEADDEKERVRHLQQFVRNVHTHIDQLSRKDYYKAEGATPEFVVLFLASEALAAEAFSLQPDLHEYASSRSIVLATPSTLIGMLKTMAFSWRQAALAESAQEIQTIGRELYDRLGILGKHFDKVGRSLTTAVGAYNDAVGSIEGRVFPTARKLRDLRVTTKELPAIQASEAAVRPLTAAELVEDAAGVPALIGRTRNAPPEAGELARPQPSLEELLRGESEVKPSRRPATGTA